MSPIFRLRLACLATGLMALGGCTTLSDYVHHGFKVGPEYSRPPACAAPHWIDHNDVRVREQSADLSCWWSVFKDPTLCRLVNCDLPAESDLARGGLPRARGAAQLGIAQGGFFPQTQTASGSYAPRRSTAVVSSPAAGPRSLNAGISASTSPGRLDFWGRLRRAITAADDQLESSVALYDDAMVTMLGDLATDYVTIRTGQRQIEIAHKTVAYYRDVVKITEQRLAAGRVSELDVDQAKSLLYQTEAQIPVLEITVRQASNALCVLLGVPAVDLGDTLGPGAIPIAPPQVVLGIPAEL